MRRDARHTDCPGIKPEHLPDDLFSQVFAPRVISTVHGAEQVAVRQAGRGGPRVNRNLRPGRHRDRSDAAVLADEIDTPTRLSLEPLTMVRIHRGGAPG